MEPRKERVWNCDSSLHEMSEMSGPPIRIVTRSRKRIRQRSWLAEIRCGRLALEFPELMLVSLDALTTNTNSQLALDIAKRTPNILMCIQACVAARVNRPGWRPVKKSSDMRRAWVVPVCVIAQSRCATYMPWFVRWARGNFCCVKKLCSILQFAKRMARQPPIVDGRCGCPKTATESNDRCRSAEN